MFAEQQSGFVGHSVLVVEGTIILRCFMCNAPLIRGATLYCKKCCCIDYPTEHAMFQSERYTDAL